MKLKCACFASIRLKGYLFSADVMHRFPSICAAQVYGGDYRAGRIMVCVLINGINRLERLHPGRLRHCMFEAESWKKGWSEFIKELRQT